MSIKQQRWTIVSCANDKFATGLIMAMASCLARSTGQVVYDFVALDGELSEVSKAKLEKVLFEVSERQQVPYTLRYIKPEKALTDRLPQRAGTWMAYARLLLYELLDDQRVVYIDSDILLMRGIEDFFTQWEKSFPFAGIQDPKKYLRKDWSLKGEKVDSKEVYFNTGLLGMDLNWMRENMTIEIFFEWVEKIGYEKLRYADQTVINTACRGLIQQMPRENNWVLATELAAQVDEKWREVNLHYVGRIKPWMTPRCDSRRYLPEMLFKKAAEVYGIAEIESRILSEAEVAKNQKKAFWYRFLSPKRAVMYQRLVDFIKPAEKIISEIEEAEFYLSK